MIISTMKYIPRKHFSSLLSILYDIIAIGTLKHFKQNDRFSHWTKYTEDTDINAIVGAL